MDWESGGNTVESSARVSTGAMAAGAGTTRGLGKACSIEGRAALTDGAEVISAAGFEGSRYSGAGGTKRGGAAGFGATAATGAGRAGS